MLDHNVHLRRARHNTSVRKKLWMDEPYWGGHTVDVSLFTAVVRKEIWACAC